MLRMHFSQHEASSNGAFPHLVADDAQRKSLIFAALSAVIALSPPPLGGTRPSARRTMPFAVALLQLASLTVAAAELQSFKVAVAASDPASPAIGRRC